jgi:hypothetical protein
MPGPGGYAAGRHRRDGGTARQGANEAELVELTAIVAVENLRYRMNAALGLTAQGFKERREPQAAESAATGTVPSAG